MKRLLTVVISALILFGSSIVLAEQSKTFDDGVTLSCTDTNVYEYVCYSDKECKEYMTGYAAILKQRYVAQESGWFIKEGKNQLIHVNLFAEHTGLYLIGRMEAERRDNRIFLKYWGIVCDIELNIGHSFYKEGLTKTILEGGK